ncbi:MAG: TM2 domain-containing protein [Bacilli bacterium]|nr:TM2 domain-containing protein [Bacilli bacterium]
MPYCKSCHAKISKFDTDICPHCGERNPIDPDYATMDITKRFDLMGDNEPLYRSKSQKTASILSMTLGYFGVHFFYIKKINFGIFAILATLVLVGGIGSALYFGADVHPAISYLAPFAAVWVYWLVYGILFSKRNSPKDGEGEFLR